MKHLTTPLALLGATVVISTAAWFVTTGGTPTAAAGPPMAVTEIGTDDAPGPTRGLLDEHDPGAVLIDAESASHLDPELRHALEAAAGEAARHGIRLEVTSGWRSPEHQAQLLRDAVRKYGTVEEAARWVATPDTSLHVSGDAVDVGPTRAADWLARHGADFGLCRVYANEPWHFELLADDGHCPPLYADPTQDPRLRK